MTIPATIIADQAVARQNFALSALKNSAKQDQAIASVLDGAIRSAPTSSIRGTNFSTKA